MSAPTPPAAVRPSPAFPSPGWWVTDREGRVVVAQPPNPALLVWLASVVIGWTGLLDRGRDEILGRVGQGALVAWSLDEVLRGSSPARRVVGAVVLVVMLVRLFA